MGGDYEVTAIEYDPAIAKIYQDFYPNDTVIVADAHQYLLEHYKEFDFVWSSPPCPTHSKLVMSNSNKNAYKLKYPDMKLYEEILLLKYFFKGDYVVENVMSYYDPLIKPQILQRHYFWSNKEIPIKEFETEKTCTTKDRERLTEMFGINIDKYTGIDKRKCLRNCVHPKVGLHILMSILEKKE